MALRAIGTGALLLALMLVLGPIAVASADEPGAQTTTGEEAPSQQSEQASTGAPTNESTTATAPEEEQTSTPSGEPAKGDESTAATEPTSEPSPQPGTQEEVSVQVPETPVSVEVPVETPPLEVVTVTEAPAVEQVKQVITETLNPETRVEKSPETSASESGKEHSSEGSGLSGTSSTPPSSITTSISTPATASNEDALAVPTSVTQDPTQILEGAEPALTSPISHRKAAAQLAAARRAGSLSCELSALEGSISRACSSESPATTLSSVGSLYIGDSDRSSATSSGARAEDSDAGSSSGDGRPAAPTPGPSPGGAAGGAAGSGGAAGGLPGFLTRPELHLRFTPRAMRRLKLAQLPWRTAFFVLIPERPG